MMIKLNRNHARYFKRILPKIWARYCEKFGRGGDDAQWWRWSCVVVLVCWCVGGVLRPAVVVAVVLVALMQ